MSRINKDAPMKAYDHVAKLLKDAGGNDGIISRADAKKIVADLKAEGRGTEALAAQNIFKMIDARETSNGTRVTGYDLKSDRSFVQEKLLENRDINNNGYSAKELEKMSPTGRALVELGRTLALEKSKARVGYSTPEAGLHHIASMIREAAGKDLITSRADRDKFCDNLYKQGRGTEMLAVRTFFDMMDHKDVGRGGRITDKDIDKGVAYATKEMLRDHDTNGNGYSKEEVATFSKSAKAFLIIGQMIDGDVIKSKASATADGVQKLLSPLLKGLELDQFGSEGGDKIRAVQRDGKFKKLDEAAFRKAFKLPDDGKPTHKLETFRDAKASDLKDLIETNMYTYKNGRQVEDPVARANIESTVALLRGLKDLKVVITGEDGRTDATHPTYFVGLAQDGSMVGIQSNVVWT